MTPLTREPKRGEDSLAERNRAVIALRAAGWPLDRVARLFGITRERVRQIESKGYEK